MQIDILLLTDKEIEIDWYLGRILHSRPTPYAVNQVIKDGLSKSQPDAWLFWDPSLGAPDPVRIQEILQLPGDLWHAGLRLGATGQPGFIDYVAPTWMLNRDPAPDIEATSWRVSLRACLVRGEVIRQIGFIRPEFRTLEAASLEWGYRCFKSGVITRHIPWLLNKVVECIFPLLPIEDELCFIQTHFGLFWSIWALARAVMTGYCSAKRMIRGWQILNRLAPPPAPQIFQRTPIPGTEMQLTPCVTVLIPTLERYAYLRTLLNQLRHQTVKPCEIIIIDQTPARLRETEFYSAYNDLPLRVIFQDSAGQCSSRNAGLQESKGLYILFLDDDEEILPDLIANHLRTLSRYRTRVSSGIANEPGIGDLPPDFQHLRISDVFPTGNSLLDKNVLFDSGLFDLAYERGQRADGDLGMRLYLSGALMILNPEISVLHHHAPRGGLRAHKGRVITYASSRKRLFQRHLLSATEFYLAKRYFSVRQIREMTWISLFSTFSLHGPPWKRLLKALFSLVFLPDSLGRTIQRERNADQMLHLFPQIPSIHK